MTPTTPSVVTDFQEARQKYHALKGQAQKAMQAEFDSCLTRAAELSNEFTAEFGGKLKLPAAVARFVPNATTKTRKPRAPKAAAAPAPAAPAASDEAPVQITGRKLAGLKKSHKSLTEKIAAAKAEGKPTRDLEDSLYQVADELRLAGVAAKDLQAETPSPAPVPAAPPQPPAAGPVHPF